MAETVKVNIQKEIFDRIGKRVETTEFKSVDEYVNYVLEEVLNQVEQEKQVYSKEDEEKVKEKLRSLGYLD